MDNFIYEHWGGIVGLAIEAIVLAYMAWKNYKESKIDSMFDGKPWNEAEYQEWIKKQKKEE